jgi:predicted nucleic acid-binding protein
LGDANVLYSRVLRDYLLYSAAVGAFSVAWSADILDEAVGHLVENTPGFTEESGVVLKRLMNEAYPLAQVDPSEGDFRRLRGVHMPDEGDRHVLAAALASEADVVCTGNTKDFPEAATAPFGIKVLTPDQLFCNLLENCPEKLLCAHRRSVSTLAGATDTSTIGALKMAGAPRTAEAMEKLLTACRGVRGQVV